MTGLRRYRSSGWLGKWTGCSVRAGVGGTLVHTGADPRAKVALRLLRLPTHTSDHRTCAALPDAVGAIRRTYACCSSVNVNVNELRLGFSNTTRNPEGILSGV